MYVASGITKHYQGVHALNGVDLTVRAGEVHALLGANGAGKSTLVKILVGAEQPTSGSLTLDGRPVRFADVGDAAEKGVAIVSQELNLFPDLSVLHNLFLTREPLRSGVLVDQAEMRRRARPVLEAVGLDVPVDRLVGQLRLSERQLVEIARALLGEPKLLLLDEPTSALRAAETARLLGVVRTLRDQGVGIVYVSHMLEDVFAVADNVTILRDGCVAVAGEPCTSMTIRGVVGHMLGAAKPLDGESAKRPERPEGEQPPHSAPLRLEGVAVADEVGPIDLTAHPGEVVGLAGLEGSGAHTVFEVIFGRRRADAGTITLPTGRPGPSSETQAVRSGVAFIPGDRRRLGLMLEKPIFENIAIVRGGPLRGMGFLLNGKAMLARAEHWRNRLGIRMSSPRTPVGHLSGGNQQKVVFAKWLETEPPLVLLDDPTRGVDIGAKAEMHAAVADMAASGRVVLVTSSDLKELSDICDRVVIFFQGRACGELRDQQLNEHSLLEAMNTGDLASC
ncbi:putative ribose/galactose/methyl galactoside import ATP-binding protein 1 [Lentzea pudingi]|uniref:Ribose/galactose/methyl galactoside import ATP-binding protein 1 n=1 Tax=Lentzea pudingi TaxID=1789439 RepID=A0ABQ2IS69_9PSEU|nr:sugar ABC transporter ATP-binding protein [Lentzea pudingi]GGN28710.1 putative ribose/galactose/methyl galactoside import ATP-binding protein 1 [Lentzea pudingi]